RAGSDPPVAPGPRRRGPQPNGVDRSAEIVEGRGVEHRRRAAGRGPRQNHVREDVVRRPSTSRRRLARGAAAALAAALLVPLSVSGVSAHPGHGEEAAAAHDAAAEIDWNDYEKILHTKAFVETIVLTWLHTAHGQ